MDRRHEAFVDAEAFFQQDVDHRGEAVRRAASVGDNVVLRRVILFVIDAHHNRDVLPLGRRGDDHLARAGAKMPFGLFRLGEQPGRFDDVLHAQLLPGKCRWAFLYRQALDLVAVDDKRVVVSHGRRGLLAHDAAAKPALRRVVFQQVRQVIGGDNIIEGHHVETPAQQTLLDQGPENQTADAAETIDANSDCHRANSFHPPARAQKKGAWNFEVLKNLSIYSVGEFQTPFFWAKPGRRDKLAGLTFAQ